MSDPTQPPSNQPPPGPSSGGGLTSGDPLGGSGSPAPGPPSYPPGYSSPAPPGAGGTGVSPAFGSAPATGGHQLGSWGARAGAAIIDGLIITVPSVILFTVFGVGIANSDGGAGTGVAIGGLLVSLLVYLAVALLYAPVLMSRWNGQTIGRRVTNIRVIRADGQPMTFGFAALREIAVKGLLVGTAGSFTFGIAYLVDFLWPLWDDENRALHDMVVNTRVVKA
ncbi:MAG TPA: RDD family protein [Solirubrobacteraceae bacterium]|nr:RDD family protein [Solirubrobacteraceae bacterium]